MARKQSRPTSTKTNSISAKLEPKPNHENQLNQEKLDNLAEKAIAKLTDLQIGQVATKSAPEAFNLQDCWEKAQLFELAIQNIEKMCEQLESQIADLEKKEAVIKSNTTDKGRQK